MTIEDLLKQKREKVTAANEIRDRVYKDQSGEWRGDDTAKFDALMTDVESISQQVERFAKLDAAEKSLADAEKPGDRRSNPNENQRHSQSQRHPGQPSKEDRALAIHGWFGAGTMEADAVTQRHREAAQRCGISLDQPKIRFQLAPVALRSADREGLRQWDEQRLTQVDVVSPDLGGHFTVPDEMMRPLEIALLEFGGMRQVSTILRTGTGAELPIPTLNDTSNSGALLGEGLEHTELDVTFDQLTLHAFKYTSRRVPVSVEYLQDNAINFVGRIGAILGERIGRITNTHFTTGDGNAKPNGIVTAATSASITTAADDAISYDNVIDLKHSVDPAYRTNARFMFNDTTLKILKKIKVPQFSGDTAGQPLWRAGMAASEPNTIDGDPYTINQQVASGVSAKAMLYGALSKYQIRDVRDITLVRLDERYAELGVVAFLAFSRHDGDLLDAGTHPVKYLTMGT
jgi:HK97 family phage major capsid protein